MSLFCKTLVLIENPDVIRVVAEAFPHPKYELEFAENLEDAASLAFSSGVDLFIVDSANAKSEKLVSIKNSFPTLIVEPEFIQGGVSKDFNTEVNRLRGVAQQLLRKSYIDWIIDTLENTN